MKFILSLLVLVAMASHAAIDWADISIPVDKKVWQSTEVSEKVAQQPLLRLYHRTQKGLVASVLKGHPETQPKLVQETCQKSKSAEWKGGKRQVCVLHEKDAHLVRYLEPVKGKVVTPVMVSFTFPKGVNARPEFDKFVEGLMK